MARPVHYFTGEDKTTCCGKVVANLGLGSQLSDVPAEVTCKYMPTTPEEVDVDLDTLEESEATFPQQGHNHELDGASHPMTCDTCRDWLNGCLDKLEDDGEGRTLEGHLAGVEVEGLKQREGDQPLPIPNGEPDIQSQVIGDIVERREVGIKRYGTALQPWNGRDPVRDLYEELLDGAMYAKQILVERAHLLNRIAELEIELATMRAGRA